MTFDHQRPSVKKLLSNARQPRIVRTRINREMTRIGDRINELDLKARTGASEFARELALEQCERMCLRRLAAREVWKE